MNKTRIRKLYVMMAVPLALLLVAAALLAWGRPGFHSAEATDSGPQMSFGVVGDDVSCDADVQPTECTAPFTPDDPATEANESKADQFTITVNATGIPDVGYSGIQLEVAGICSPEIAAIEAVHVGFEAGPWGPAGGCPAGLAWNPRAIDCEDPASPDDPDRCADPDLFGLPPRPLEREWFSTPYLDGEPDPDPNDGDTYAAEVVWPDFAVNASGRPVLVQASIGPAGQRLLGGGTGVALPFPLSTYVGTLVELDVHCKAAGTFSLALTGLEPGVSTFGATYFDIDGEPVPAKMIGEAELDLDNDTVTETVQLADSLEINCEGPAGVTPTPTEGPTITPGGPTATVGPTNTPTPTSAGPVAIPTPCVGVCPQITLGATGNVSCNDANNPTACRVSVPPGGDDQAGFTLIVNAGEIPAGGYGGFTLDLFFGGLEYHRESCSNEVIWPDEFFCLAFDGPGGQRQLRSGTGVFPPLPPSNYLGRLATFDLRCPGLGQFMVTLTAAPSTPLGASYVDPNGATVFVDPPGQQFVDTDGDTVPEAVDAADALLINCRPPEGAGDVNGSGTVDSLDTLWLLWHIAGLRDEVPNPESMDVNADGVIDAIDATLILQFAAGLIRSVSPGGPGDVNGDGLTDNLDALWALWLLAGIVDAVHSPEHMDVNDDGTANAIDVTLILQLDAGLIDSLSPPEGS
jgi:hypothetical protein